MDKTLDNKGRWRNVIISFRMSPQERDDLNVRVKLSGLTKQDYIIKRLSERDVIVQPNTRVYKALRNQMADILTELRRIENSANIDSDLLDKIQITVQTYNGLAEKKSPNVSGNTKGLGKCGKTPSQQGYFTTPPANLQ